VSLTDCKLERSDPQSDNDEAFKQRGKPACYITDALFLTFAVNHSGFLLSVGLSTKLLINR